MIEYLEFVAVGVLAGVASGFFGIGGGTIVVPLLVAIGVGVKSAIGLSAMQMSFSSFYGSYLNIKSKLLDPMRFLPLGIGGIFGGALGAKFLDYISSITASYVFVVILAIALYKAMTSKPEEIEKPFPHWILLFLTGLFVGIVSGMVGMGGGFILVPILASVMGIPLKKTVAVGLYFVVFVGTTAFLTLLILGYVDLISGAFLSIGSIIGVRLGILIASRTSTKRHHLMVVILYLLLLSLMIYKIYKGEV